MAMGEEAIRAERERLTIEFLEHKWKVDVQDHHGDAIRWLAVKVEKTTGELLPWCFFAIGFSASPFKAQRSTYQDGNLIALSTIVEARRIDEAFGTVSYAILAFPDGLWRLDLVHSPHSAGGYHGGVPVARYAWADHHPIALRDEAPDVLDSLFPASV